MASTRFGEPSGAWLAALVVLVVAVLAGSFAPRAQAQNITRPQLTVQNTLIANVRCTYPASATNSGPNLTFIVPANSTVSRPIPELELPLPSAAINITLRIPGFRFRLIYTTPDTPMARAAFPGGFRVVILDRSRFNCTGSGQGFAFKFEGYSSTPLGVEGRVYSRCVRPVTVRGRET